MRWWLGCCLGLLLCTASLGYTEDRRGSSFDHEHWEGSRTYRPERPRGWRERDLPDRFTIDKPGKCEVRCESDGRGRYKCKEYRC
jgi:hypothetical protein